MSDTKQEPYRLNDAELDRLAEKPVLGAELAADRLRWTEAEIDRLRAEVAARTAERDALKPAAKPLAKRKVVQLIVLPQSGQNWNELYALADDGTIWQRYEPNGWSQSLDIPQPQQEVQP
jgi:hypothetical protein